MQLSDFPTLKKQSWPRGGAYHPPATGKKACLSRIPTKACLAVSQIGRTSFRLPNCMKPFHRNLQRKTHMKPPRLQINLVMAAAIGPLVLIISTTHAGRPDRLTQFTYRECDATALKGRSIERAKPDS